MENETMAIIGIVIMCIGGVIMGFGLGMIYQDNKNKANQPQPPPSNEIK